MDWSKNAKIKMSIAELMKDTQMNEKQIINSILNEYKEPEKSGSGFLSELIKQGSKKISISEIFPKK